MSDEIDSAPWYSDVPPILDSKQLARLLSTNEQIIRAYAGDGVLPAHRKPGGRKFTFLRHEIFHWLIGNRYELRRPTTSRAIRSLAAGRDRPSHAMKH